MSSPSFSAIVTLESALALLSESLENLKAAGSIEAAQLSEQLRVAAESAGKVRESVLSKMPESSPQSRQELDALVEKIRETLEARRMEHQRSRLLALATELERGTVVHRRALRVSEVNQLREQAVAELRAHAQSEAPPTLPGPAAAHWVEWACGLQEPHDAECLQLLQSGFALLDHFVANLEPNSWHGAELPAAGILPGANTSPDTKPSQPSNSETSFLETPVASSLLPQIETVASESQRGEDRSPFSDLLLKRRPRAAAEDAFQPSEEEREQILARERARLDSLMARGHEPAQTVEQRPPLPDVFQKGSPRGFESNTLTPHDATPPRGEEEDQQVAAQERALLDGMMGLTQDPAAYFSAQATEPITELVSHLTSAEPAPATGTIPTHGSLIDLPLSTEAVREAKAAGVAVGTRALTHADSPVERTAVVTLTRGSAAAAVATAPVVDVNPGVEGSVIEFLSKANGTAASADLDSMLILPETDTLPTIHETRANAVLRNPRILLLTALLLVLTVLAVLVWRPWTGARQSDKSSAVAAAVSAPDPKATSSAPGTTGAVPAQLAIPANSATQTTAAKTPTRNQDINRESLNSKPTAQASSTTQASGHSDQVPSPGAPSPAGIISVPQQQAVVSSMRDAAIPLPNELANGAPSSMPAMVGNIPAAVPGIANQGRLSISSGVAQGLLTRQVNPRYPQRAIQDRIQGTVVLQAVIAKDGSVQNIRAVSGNAMLITAAMDAVKQWRYKPYQLNGEPVEADTEINVKFKLASE